MSRTKKPDLHILLLRGVLEITQHPLLTNAQMIERLWELINIADSQRRAMWLSQAEYNAVYESAKEFISAWTPKAEGVQAAANPLIPIGG